MCAVYTKYACDLKTRADLDTFIVHLFRIPRFRVVLLFVVNIDNLNTSRRAPKPLQGKRKTGYNAGENGLYVWQGQPSIGRKD